MAMPLVVSFWMRAAFTFVDTIFAATLGDESVAAIGLAIPLEFLMVAFWVGLSNSLTSNLSRTEDHCFDRRNRRLSGQVTWELLCRRIALQHDRLTLAAGERGSGLPDLFGDEGHQRM